MGDGTAHRRDLRLLVAAVGVSALGDFLLWVPLTLHIQEMTDSGFAVAGLMICLWLPIVVLAPVAGLVVDRVETRKVLLVAALGQAVVAAALGSALDSVAAILVLAAALGVGAAFAQPAEFALVPVVASGRELTSVNGQVETSRYVGMTLGPLLGGFLSAAGGVDVAMVANAVTFALLALAALFLHARRPARAASLGDGDRARDGVVYLFRDRTLGLVMGAIFVSLLFFSASITAEVFFAKENLKVSDAIYGVLFTGWTAGMVFGALVVSRRIPRSAIATAALVAVGVQGLGLGLPTAWVVTGFAIAMWFVGGVGHGVKNVLARTLIQERVPDRLHGRAFAAYNGMRNGAELIAMAAGGALVAAIGGRTTLALAGAIPVAVAAAALAIQAGRGRIGWRRPATDPGGAP